MAVTKEALNLCRTNIISRPKYSSFLLVNMSLDVSKVLHPLIPRNCCVLPGMLPSGWRKACLIFESMYKTWKRVDSAKWAGTANARSHVIALCRRMRCKCWGTLHHPIPPNSMETTCEADLQFQVWAISPLNAFLINSGLFGLDFPSHGKPSLASTLVVAIKLNQTWYDPRAIFFSK